MVPPDVKPWESVPSCGHNIPVCLPLPYILCGSQAVRLGFSEVTSTHDQLWLDTCQGGGHELLKLGLPGAVLPAADVHISDMDEPGQFVVTVTIAASIICFTNVQ